MIYIAMFDEMDEGTAIFKCTNSPPTTDGVPFVGYEGLPSDYYLRLAGEANFGTSVTCHAVNEHEIEDLVGIGRDLVNGLAGHSGLFQ